MAKIYIDTNRYLDFYRSSGPDSNVLDQVLPYKSSLIITDQTVSEFRRNREKTLKGLRSELEEWSKKNPPNTALLDALDEGASFNEARAAYKTSCKDLVKKINSLIEDVAADAFAGQLLTLSRDDAVSHFCTTKDTVSLAHQRKLLGRPPTSKDKYTIGDELIWELLLANVKADLIVVTRDSSFHTYSALLTDEYLERTQHKLILVTAHFHEALKAIGVKPSQELIDAEEKADQIASTINLPCDCVQGPIYSDWVPDGRFLLLRCIRCGRVLGRQENPDIE